MAQKVEQHKRKCDLHKSSFLSGIQSVELQPSDSHMINKKENIFKKFKLTLRNGTLQQRMTDSDMTCPRAEYFSHLKKKQDQKSLFIFCSTTATGAKMKQSKHMIPCCWISQLNYTCPAVNYFLSPSKCIESLKTLKNYSQCTNLMH